MAYRIDDSCINCGACTPECPVEAIKKQLSLEESQCS